MFPKPRSREADLEVGQGKRRATARPPTAAIRAATDQAPQDRRRKGTCSRGGRRGVRPRTEPSSGPLVRCDQCRAERRARSLQPGARIASAPGAFVGPLGSGATRVAAGRRERVRGQPERRAGARARAPGLRRRSGSEGKLEGRKKGPNRRERGGEHGARPTGPPERRAQTGRERRKDGKGGRGPEGPKHGARNQGAAARRGAKTDKGARPKRAETPGPKRGAAARRDGHRKRTPPPAGRGRVI